MSEQQNGVSDKCCNCKMNIICLFEGCERLFCQSCVGQKHKNCTNHNYQDYKCEIQKWGNMIETLRERSYSEVQESSVISAYEKLDILKNTVNNCIENIQQKMVEFCPSIKPHAQIFSNASDSDQFNYSIMRKELYYDPRRRTLEFKNLHNDKNSHYTFPEQISRKILKSTKDLQRDFIHISKSFLQIIEEIASASPQSPQRYVEKRASKLLDKNSSKIHRADQFILEEIGSSPIIEGQSNSVEKNEPLKTVIDGVGQRDMKEVETLDEKDLVKLRILKQGLTMGNLMKAARMNGVSVSVIRKWKKRFENRPEIQECIRSYNEKYGMLDKYTKEEKEKILLELDTGSSTKMKIAKKYKIHPTTLRKWEIKYTNHPGTGNNSGTDDPNSFEIEESDDDEEEEEYMDADADDDDDDDERNGKDNAPDEIDLKKEENGSDYVPDEIGCSKKKEEIISDKNRFDSPISKTQKSNSVHQVDEENKSSKHGLIEIPLRHENGQVSKIRKEGIIDPLQTVLLMKAPVEFFDEPQSPESCNGKEEYRPGYRTAKRLKLPEQLAQNSSKRKTRRTLSPDETQVDQVQEGQKENFFISEPGFRLLVMFKVFGEDKVSETGWFVACADNQETIQIFCIRKGQTGYTLYSSLKSTYYSEILRIRTIQTEKQSFLIVLKSNQIEIWDWRSSHLFDWIVLPHDADDITLYNYQNQKLYGVLETGRTSHSLEFSMIQLLELSDLSSVEASKKANMLEGRTKKWKTITISNLKEPSRISAIKVIDDPMQEKPKYIITFDYFIYIVDNNGTVVFSFELEKEQTIIFIETIPNIEHDRHYPLDILCATKKGWIYYISLKQNKMINKKFLSNQPIQALRVKNCPKGQIIAVAFPHSLYFMTVDKLKELYQLQIHNQGQISYGGMSLLPSTDQKNKMKIISVFSVGKQIETFPFLANNFI